MIISQRLALHGMGQAIGRKDVIHHLNSGRKEQISILFMISMYTPSPRIMENGKRRK